MKNGNNGIVCDLCAAERRNDFIYYSFDFRLITVINNKHQLGLEQQPIIFSLDSCGTCMEKIGESIKIHYRPATIGIACDFCSGLMRDNYVFYYCTVSEVKVFLSSGKLVCVSCGAQLASEKQCKCLSTNIKRLADVNVDSNFLHIALCPNDYSELTNLVSKTRQKLGNIK